MIDSKISPPLLYTGHLSFLEQQLPQVVAKEKSRDPLAEVWVIVPNQLTRLHLRRVLAKALGTVANVRFMTVTDVMHKLAEPLTMREGWHTLGESVVDPLLAEIIESNSKQLEYLAPVASSRGFRSALLRTRQELILHQIDPERLNQVPLRERERAAKVRDLILLLTRINEFLAKQRLHDGASLQTLALRALHEDGAQIPPTLLYSLYDLAPLTRSVLKLVALKTSTHAFLPWQAEDIGYNFTESLFRWYMDSGFECESESETFETYAPIRFVSAPKDSAVATEIIRDVIYAEDILPGDAAIMLPQSESLLTSVLESRCRISGLSPYIYQAKTLGACAAGRGFAALAHLLDGKFALAQVTAFLLAAPFKQPVAALTGEWCRLAQESLVVSGEQEWRHRIARMLAKLERRAERLSENEEDETNLTALRRRIESGKALLTFLEELFVVLNRIRTEKNRQTSIFTLWEYYHPKIGLSEEFADLTLQLEQASVLDQANVSLTSSGLTEFILATLETPGMRTGTFGASTPLIAPRDQCIGTSFGHVFLPGFNEGTIPRMQRQDPLLLDSDRKDINETLATSLPLASDSLIRERFVLEMQLRAASKTITLYASRADADGRPQLLSPYVAELLERQIRVETDTVDIEKLLETPPNRSVPAHPLEGCPPMMAISETEYNRMALGDPRIGLGHLTQNDNLERALKVEHARFHEQRFSKFDGMIENDTVRKSLAHRFSPDQPIAATSLEEYWKCPFRFLVLKEWEAYAPEEIELLSPVTSRERGLLFHSILQRYHGDRLNLQITVENYALSDLINLARRVVSEYARNNPVGPRFSQAKLEWDILETLVTYHRELIELGGTWRTRHVEVSFGYGDNPFPDAAQFTSDDTRFIRFKGRIDRWDSDDSGTQILITDYKSGKGPQKNSRGAERRLQLGVYHLLAQSSAPDAHVESRYIYLELEKNREVKSDEERELHLKTSLNLLEDIRGGIFVPDPSEKDSTVCKHCTAKLACGAQRHSAKELNAQTVSGMLTIRPRADDNISLEGDDDE